MQEMLPFLYSDDPILVMLGFVGLSVALFALCACWALIISYVLTDLGVNFVSEVENVYLRLLIIFISGPVGWVIAFWVVVVKPSFYFFRE